MKTRLVALAAILIPSIALAQSPTDPDDPSAPPPAPAPVVVPAPEPQPTVIVNPPPEPPRTVIVTQPEYETYTDAWNAPLFLSGALLFAGSYGTSVAVAASSENDSFDRGNHHLYVPVVGPWLALQDRPDCPISNESCDRETTKKVLLVADGILQAGGVITMISGLLIPAEHRVLTRPARVSTKVRVTPTASAGGPGVLLSGRW